MHLQSLFFCKYIKYTHFTSIIWSKKGSCSNVNESQPTTEQSVDSLFHKIFYIYKIEKWNISLKLVKVQNKK